MKKLWLPALALALLVFTVSPAQQSGQTLSYLFTPDLPHDFIAPIPGATGFQGAANAMSWQSFVAVNWPAAPGKFGVPDRNNFLGGFPKGGYLPGGLPIGPTVWETWKAPADVFLNPPRKPDPWDTPQTIPPQCKQLVAANGVANGPGAIKILTMRTKVSQFLDSDDQAFAGPLNDQNGKRVWYEVRMNEAAFNYIVEHKFYDSNNQKGATIRFPHSSNDGTGIGAMFVKAAWKQIDPVKDAWLIPRIYTRLSYIMDPISKQCTAQTVGLVGLHIIHKTATRPQWVWSTFEQIDNAPTEGTTPPSGAHFSFNNPASNEIPNQQPTKTNPYKPVQVARVVPIDAVAAGLTSQYQATMREVLPDHKTPWQFYELVNTQWPAAPKDPAIPFGGPQPTYLANAVLETYFQDPVTPNPITPANPPHSCMACHGHFAPSTDFDFQLHKACPAAQWCKQGPLLTEPRVRIPEANRLEK